MTNENIIEFLSNKDYDVRKTHNARWIDQKCTPDVVCIVADCITNFINNDVNKTFTSRDIWFSTYAKENIQAIFKKVEVVDTSVQNEYDKFFQQPMKLMAYSGILSEQKRGRENIYKVENLELLNYIANRERNALTFLVFYIKQVLKDSGIWDVFKNFLDNTSKENFNELKTSFSTFTIQNTSIGNKTSYNGKNEEAGVVECNRIFSKVINPLAFSYNKQGTLKGHLSPNKITYDVLMYNRDNFRDIYSEKPKEMSRKDYLAINKITINTAYYQYQSSKAKAQLRKYNDIFRSGLSEILDTDDRATHMHHIFLASEYPEISGYLENLIALTPTQHLNYAHPNGHTAEINKDYQYKCLMAKIDSIKENFKIQDNIIYNFNDFLFVLQTGLSDNTYLEIENNDFDGIQAKLILSYA